MLTPKRPRRGIVHGGGRCVPVADGPMTGAETAKPAFSGPIQVRMN